MFNKRAHRLCQSRPATRPRAPARVPAVRVGRGGGAVRPSGRDRRHHQSRRSNTNTRRPARCSQTWHGGPRSRSFLATTTSICPRRMRAGAFRTISRDSSRVICRSSRATFRPGRFPASNCAARWPSSPCRARFRVRPLSRPDTSVARNWRRSSTFWRTRPCAADASHPDPPSSGGYAAAPGAAARRSGGRRRAAGCAPRRCARGIVLYGHLHVRRRCTLAHACRSARRHRRERRGARSSGFVDSCGIQSLRGRRPRPSRPRLRRTCSTLFAAGSRSDASIEPRAAPDAMPGAADRSMMAMKYRRLARADEGRKRPSSGVCRTARLVPSPEHVTVVAQQAAQQFAWMALRHHRITARPRPRHSTRCAARPFTRRSMSTFDWRPS